jgi:hypothetical protein
LSLVILHFVWAVYFIFCGASADPALVIFVCCRYVMVYCLVKLLGVSSVRLVKIHDLYGAVQATTEAMQRNADKFPGPLEETSEPLTHGKDAVLVGLFRELKPQLPLHVLASDRTAARILHVNLLSYTYLVC